MQTVFRRSIRISALVTVIVIKIFRFPEQFGVFGKMPKRGKFFVRKEQTEAFIAKKCFQPGTLQTGQRQFSVSSGKRTVPSMIRDQEFPFAVRQFWQDIKAAFCKAASSFLLIGCVSASVRI